MARVSTTLIDALVPEDAEPEVCVQGQDERKGELGFWQGAWLGALVALGSNMRRNLGSCACCLVIAGLLLLLLTIAVVAVFLEIWPIVLLAIAAVVALRLLYLWRRGPPAGPARRRLP